VLETLAATDGGRWELVKLSTDEHPEIAQQYGVQGIPAVKLFVDGQVRGEFAGALPQAEVRRWLDEHLPDPDTDALRLIVDRWPTRGPEVAEELERFVADHPDHPEARLRLAQALVGVAPERARELARIDSQDAALTELGDDVAVLAELMLRDAGDAPDRLRRSLREAAGALARHDLNASLERLVEAATIDSGYGDQLARRAAVALFHLLGQDHESTREYRQRLATALLS
jgi:putative thioredoxin